MKANAATEWISKNWKGVAIGLALLTIFAVVARTLYKVFAPVGGSAPDISNPKDDPYVQAKIQQVYEGIKGSLPKDPLIYKSLADSLQGYLQSTTFFFYSDVYDTYFKNLADNEFIAVFYFWGNREYSGSVWSNPFQGLDDKYGTLSEALKARCFEADYNKIKTQFSSTGLI